MMLARTEQQNSIPNICSKYSLPVSSRSMSSHQVLQHCSKSLKCWEFKNRKQGNKGSTQHREKKEVLEASCGWLIIVACVLEYIKIEDMLLSHHDGGWRTFPS